MKTNTLNRSVIFMAILIVCIVFCMLFSASQNIAYATSVSVVESDFYVNYDSIDSTNFYRDTTIQNAGREYPISGTNFAFELGAGVLKNDLGSLVFRLNLSKPEFEKDKASFYNQSFVLYECSADGKTFNPIMDVVILHFTSNGVQAEELMFKRFEYSDTKIGIVNYKQVAMANVRSPFDLFYLLDGYEVLGTSASEGSNLLINGGHTLSASVTIS